MPDTLLIGGQPDYLTAITDGQGNHLGLTTHGREIVSGDAEKTMDLTPSTRYRLPSIGSGEPRYLHRNFGSQQTLAHMIGCIVHNLDGVGAKARMVVGGNPECIDTAPPTTTVDDDNTTSGFADVDQDPFGTISTLATPTLPQNDWMLEVGGFSGTTLQLAVEDSQTVWVYLKWNGTYSNQDTSTVLIEAYEGAALKAEKNLRIRAEDGDTFIIALLVDPNDFSDTTLAGMSIRVTFSGTGNAGLYWEIGAIQWMRVKASGLQNDTGWIPVEQPYAAPLTALDEVQQTSALPVLDGDGVLTFGLGPHVYWMIYWDDSVDEVVAGRPRIFWDPLEPDIDKLGTVTEWKPEIGLLAVGPCVGTGNMEFGYTLSWVDPSVVVTTIGGNRWVHRISPYRRLEVGMHEIPATDASREWIATMRRAGVARPFIVCIKTGNDDITASASIYASLSSFSAVSVRKDSNGEWFQIKMVFEECL